MNVALFVGDMRIGGVTTFVLNLGSFLLRAGHAVTLVACGEGEWWPRLAERGIPAALVAPGPWESMAHHARRLAGYFSTERYDVVFLNNGLGVRPAMVGLHLWPDSIAAIPVLHNDLARVYAHAQINRAAWNVAIVASPKVGRTAAVLMPDKRIETIPYGIALPTAQQLATRADWELPLRLLFVGGLSDAHKGILRLPTILAGCRTGAIPVRLTVIGDGGDREHLEMAFAQRDLADLVEIRGTQPAAAVCQAMQTHHVLLMPSNYEGLPLVSLEAQANGCVPVASRLAGITDFAIQDGVSGYLAEPGDIQMYVRHIASLQDAECWGACSRAGIERARRLFAVEVMGRHYEDLIGQVAGGAYPLAGPRAAAPKARNLFLPKDYLPGRMRGWLGQLRRYREGRR